MRRVFISALVIAMILSLCSCGKEERLITEANETETIETEANETETIETETIETEANETEDNEIEDHETEAEEAKGSVEIPSRTISLGDIDGNGVQDYIIVEENLNFTWDSEYYIRWTFYFNNEQIYQGYHELMCDAEAWYLDLDDDGEEEIFIPLYPYVNSMPLTEYVTLKHSGDGWIELENSKEFDNNGQNGLSNSFPIHVYYGKSKYVFEIVCDGFELIEYDVKDHYEKMYEEYKSDETSFLYQLANDILHSDKYSVGNEMGQTASWGIWELRRDSIDGKECIVATHGIEGLEGKYDMLGTMDIFFNYDTEGKIQILKMNFIPME